MLMQICRGTKEKGVDNNSDPLSETLIAAGPKSLITKLGERWEELDGDIKEESNKKSEKIMHELPESWGSHPKLSSNLP